MHANENLRYLMLLHPVMFKMAFFLKRRAKEKGIENKNYIKKGGVWGRRMELNHCDLKWAEL
jgi:hypothetical protein